MPPRSPAFAPARVVRTPRAGGGFVLSSPEPLGVYARAVGDWLERWAVEAPERTFLAERDADGAWARLSYAAARASVRSVAQGLLDLGLDRTTPLMLLSGNSVDHAILQLAAMHIGVPAAPVSPAYSLVSQDFAKLRAIEAQLAPGAVYASDATAFARALAALDGATPHLTSLDGLRATTPTAAVDRAFAAVGPDTIAKVLFTSGSTGSPKGVVNTQRMLCSNQQAIAQVWPFLAERAPVVVDWLPWSHTFGGNHNFNMVLANGGTLYIDRGKPAPKLIELTAQSLREISPTLYFNVPRGFDMLLPLLERDAALRESLFRELDLLFYAAAALPQSLWQRLEAVSLAARGDVAPMVSAWGSTETAPLVTSVHFAIPRAGVIGLPAPGCELAFVPSEEKLEMRVKGPNVTPGAWEPGGGVRGIALDAEGFLATGDAGRLEDDAEPSKGVLFDGRTAENFKLTSGTWVRVGELRVRVIEACAGLVQDAVVTGHDRDEIGVLLFLGATSIDEARRRVPDALARYNREHSASSTRVARALFLVDPPSIDGGEITDKGYLNQRAVLTRRSGQVERLYEGGEDVIILG